MALPRTGSRYHVHPVPPRRPRVTVYYRQREGYWTIRWREQGRQLEQGGYTTEDEAEDDADAIRKRLRTGLPGIRAPRRVADIVQHWWDTYVTTGSVTQATRETYQADVPRIIEYIGDRDAGIRRGEVREWRDVIAAEHGPRAANKAHTALSSAYERALEASPPLAEENPCRGITRLPETMQPVVIPTRAQVAYLEQAAPHDRERAWLLVASRGALRQSELFGLRWPSVRENAVYVAEVADRSRTIRESTKTKRSERRVPLPPRAIEALEQLRPGGSATGLVAPSASDPDRPVARSSWTKTYWTPWRRDAAWRAAEAGEPPLVWRGIIDMQWKYLRHHAISRWAAAKATMLQVSRWSGDSLATIDKHYAFLFDEDEADVMLEID